ncbi:MAG: hypothetical protein HYY17_10595 [Planctomycetes bacterium]|nr:hypothetical protein [Planctomycetota bacterium]
MLFASLAISMLGQAQDTGEQFYKFKVGTRWVLESAEGGRLTTVTIKVVRVEESRVTVESSEMRPNRKEPKVETLVWSVNDGYLIWSEVKGEKTKDVFRLYKVGSKKGDTWKSPWGGGSDEVEVTHLGTEEVEVPAGKFADAVHVQMARSVKMGDQEVRMAVDFFLVPNVGLVKMELSSAKSKSTVLLKEIKKAE